MTDNSQGWRFTVKLAVPPVMFAKHVKHNGYTVRTLAVEVSRRTKESCSHSTIGHLMTGERRAVGDNKARALEEILGVPRGSLFVASVSRVARDVTGKAVA